MNSDRSIYIRWVSSAVLIACHLGWWRPVSAGEDPIALAEVAGAEGQRYVELRNLLLERHRRVDLGDCSPRSPTDPDVRD